LKKHTDLRVVKTRRLIKEVFFELLNKSGLDKITVSDIASQAMINRATFYLHYRDKYDLLSSIESEVLDGLKSFGANVQKEDLLRCIDQRLPFPHIVKMLAYVQENAIFFNLIVRNNVDPSFVYRMETIVDNMKLCSIFNELKPDETFFNYSSQIIPAIFVSTTNQWIKTGMKESATEIAAFITKIASAFLFTFTDLGKQEPVARGGKSD
jgi:AcrR family transcriptional regulator